jgi:hypothetical protein
MHKYTKVLNNQKEDYTEMTGKLEAIEDEEIRSGFVCGLKGKGDWEQDDDIY